MTELAGTFRAMLSEAGVALARGDAAEAERRAKAVSALIRAERDVAEFLAAERAKSPEENEEARRAELRRRLSRFVESAGAGAPDDVLERIGTRGLVE